MLDSTAFRTKEGTKGPESSKPHPSNQLVRMRSPVQIWVAAPQNTRFSSEKRVFYLLFATIFDSLNFDFCL